MNNQIGSSLVADYDIISDIKLYENDRIGTTYNTLSPSEMKTFPNVNIFS